jgi:hypothetical protein
VAYDVSVVVTITSANCQNRAFSSFSPFNKNVE